MNMKLVIKENALKRKSQEKYFDKSVLWKSQPKLLKRNAERLCEK